MLGLSAQPANLSRQRNPFQVALLVGLISILIFVLVLDALSLVKKFRYAGGNESQNTTGKPENILVLFDIYKNPYDKYIIYQVALDGRGEKEIWSQSIKNTYQFSPISYPFMSNDRNYLFYPASFDPPSPENFSIISATTGKTRLIPNHYKEYAAFGCSWNHSNTKIACLMESSGEEKPFLVVINTKDGTSAKIASSIKNDRILSSLPSTSWDKTDENIFVPGLNNNKHTIFKVTLASKEVTEQKGLTGQSELFPLIYSAQLNKFVYLDDGKKLKLFNPDDQTVKLLYENPDHYINDYIFLTEDGKSLIFREDDFVFGFDQSVEPKDGVPTSKIMKLSLVSGKKQEFDYPFDSKKNPLNLIEHYAGGDVVIISNFELTSANNPSNNGEIMYAYNLSSKKLIKVFSRSDKDYSDKQIQFGVIRY